MANPEVVCSIQVGMLRGALAELSAPLDATRLEVMVLPTLCVASGSDVQAWVTRDILP